MFPFSPHVQIPVSSAMPSPSLSISAQDLQHLILQNQLQQQQQKAPAATPSPARSSSQPQHQHPHLAQQLFNNINLVSLPGGVVSLPGVSPVNTVSSQFSLVLNL